MRGGMTIKQRLEEMMHFEDGERATYRGMQVASRIWRR